MHRQAVVAGHQCEPLSGCCDWRVASGVVVKWPLGPALARSPVPMRRGEGADGLPVVTEGLASLVCSTQWRLHEDDVGSS